MCDQIIADLTARLKKLYFFQIVKERKNSDLEKIKPKHTLLRRLRLHSQEEWWRMTGSNRRPPACKAGALPAELIPLCGGSGWIRTNDPRVINTVL